MIRSEFKKSGDMIIQECFKILKNDSFETIAKWIVDSKITSLHLRNVKAIEIINISNYIMQKMMINQNDHDHQFITLLFQYNKNNSNKCYEYSKLIKHFSQWDYEFQYIYQVAIGNYLEQISLYLKIRDLTLRGDFNKAKKDILSGITLQLQQWALLAKNVFKQKEEEEVIDQFTTVVKNHYVKVKKTQTQKINGAQFLKICQIMQNSSMFKDKENQPLSSKKDVKEKHNRSPEKILSIFDETLLNGLSTQDKELIRVLSYKNKNIAQMLQEKHTKMVHLIGEEVNTLRKDINKQKQRYVEVVEQKNALMRLMQRIKESSLKYIIERKESNQFQLLQLLDTYNKKYSPKSIDVIKTTQLISNRRLIEIIQRQQLQED